MKLNKKGFTLIELLAVIVILAVIALIAVPQVIKILNQARRSAAEDSAYGILKAAESYVATYMLDNQGDWMGDVDFVCSSSKGCVATVQVPKADNPSEKESKEITLDFKGTKPTAGTVNLSSQGEATIKSALTINGFTCTQSGDKVSCSNDATTTTTSSTGE